MLITDMNKMWCSKQQSQSLCIYVGFRWRVWSRVWSSFSSVSRPSPLSTTTRSFPLIQQLSSTGCPKSTCVCLYTWWDFVSLTHTHTHTHTEVFFILKNMIINSEKAAATWFSLFCVFYTKGDGDALHAGGVLGEGAEVHRQSSHAAWEAEE